MKKIYKTLLKGAFLSMIIGFASCTSYLDKAPDSDVNPDAAFKNFSNFQGFVEQIYACIPDKENNYYTTSFNWGDDEVFNSEGNWHTTAQFDLGNFWAWQSEFQSQPGNWFDKGSVNMNNDRMGHALWTQAWYCIRVANL